jgi:hypothetical protein
MGIQLNLVWGIFPPFVEGVGFPSLSTFGGLLTGTVILKTQ